jgi:hypothetical protein
MYIGTKLVHLTPMNRAEYNDYRSWPLPTNEDGSDEGYLVEYTDGGKPNDPRHSGYISWSPKAQADAAYRKVDALTFGLAIEGMRKGLRASRQGWNGKGMWLCIVQPHEYNVINARAMGYEQLPFIVMRTAVGAIVPWLASQTDILAEDWELLP